MAATDVAMAQVGRALEDSTEDLISRQLEALKSHPQYAKLRELDLRHSALRNVRRTVFSIGCGDLLDGPEYDHVVSTVLHVIPDLGPEEIVSAYRVAMSVIRDAFIEEASRSDMPTAVAATGLRTIWELTDRYSVLLASAHGPAMPCDRADRRTRARFLSLALCGELRETERELGAAQLALPPDLPVRVFRVRVPGQLTQRLMRHMESQALGWPSEPLLTRIDNDLAGLSQDRCQPGAAPEDALIAMSEPVMLTELHQGYVRASQILDTARRFGLHGVFTSSDLGLRSAILAMPATSQELMAKYIRSVKTSTPMAADLLYTVETFLQCKRRFQHTAQVLNMHVNSLRHRLERYREITGADLSDTETVAEVWWALQYGHALEAGVDVLG